MNINDYKFIPESLKAERKWICFRLEMKDGRLEKVPVSPQNGSKINAHDPDNWVSYHDACQAVSKLNLPGIGFVLSNEDSYVVVDLDHCIDEETKELSPLANEIIQMSNTYTEVSISGKGLHLVFKGKKPGTRCKNEKQNIEMYEKKRFFAMTGNLFPGATSNISDCQNTITKIYTQYLVPHSEKGSTQLCASKSSLTDEEIIDRVQSGGNPETSKRLWSGRWEEDYKSQSEADMSLCCKLAFWTNKDPDRMDKLFRQSGLIRDKWDRPDGENGLTYGTRTINRALELTVQGYSGRTSKGIFEYKNSYCIQKNDHIEPLTNFIIERGQKVQGTDSAQINAVVRTNNSESLAITLSSNDFCNVQSFKAKLNANSFSLAFYGTATILEHLKIHINSLPLEIKYGVKESGIHFIQDRVVAVYGKNVLVADDGPDPDVVQLDGHADLRTDLFGHTVLNRQQLCDILPLLISYNDPSKTVTILAWICAVFIKSHLKKNGVKFPHLFLTGEAGSGKSTTLESIILRCFSTSQVTACAQVTKFSLLREASSSNLIPIALDEFKPSKIDKRTISVLSDLFRNSYDAHSGKRGQADQTVTTYELQAPLVIVGEQSSTETAIQERSLQVYFSKRTLKDPGHSTSLLALRSSRHLEDFGRTLLEGALKTDSNTAYTWYLSGLNAFNGQLPSRILNNLACAYAGLSLLKRICEEHSLEWDSVFPIPFQECIRNLEFAAKNYLLNGSAQSIGVVEKTFEIMARMDLDYAYCHVDQKNKESRKLYIRLSDVYDQFTRYVKDHAIDTEVLELRDFKKQLKNSDLFVSSNIAKRVAESSHKYWIIDYELLCTRCGDEVEGFLDNLLKS